MLTAMIGELPCSNIRAHSPAFAAMQIRGSMAHVPQKAWIFNASLSDNITFGLPYEEEKVRC